MKKNRIKFLMIEFLLLMLAVSFVWKIFDQNVAETRIAVILPESGDKRWDALINGMKQSAVENNVHMIICNTEEIDGPEVEREFIREQKDNDIDGFIIYPAPGHETENMLKKECGNKPYLLIADSLAVKEGETATVSYKLTLKDNYNKEIINKILPTNTKVDLKGEDSEGKKYEETSTDSPKVRVLYEDKKDNTIANTIIPQTGEGNAISTIICVIATVAIIAGIRYFYLKKNS